MKDRCQKFYGGGRQRVVGTALDRYLKDSVLVGCGWRATEEGRPVQNRFGGVCGAKENVVVLFAGISGGFFAAFQILKLFAKTLCCTKIVGHNLNFVLYVFSMMLYTCFVLPVCMLPLLLDDDGVWYAVFVHTIRYDGR